LVRENLRLAKTAIASLEAFALGNLRYEVNVSEKRMTLKRDGKRYDRSNSHQLGITESSAENPFLSK
jgi:hypothetical protein